MWHEIAKLSLSLQKFLSHMKLLGKYHVREDSARNSILEALRNFQKIEVLSPSIQEKVQKVRSVKKLNKQ